MSKNDGWNGPVLLIGATTRGKIGTVNQKIDFIKSILQTLEEVSPWSLPTYASGSTAATAKMEIGLNFDNFSETTLKAMMSDVPSLRKVAPSDLNAKELEDIGLEVGGVTYSSYQREANASDIRVSFNLAGSLSFSPINGIAISLFNHKSTDRNGWWGRSENVMSIMSALIDLIDPCTFSALDTSTQYSVLDGSLDHYAMSWLSYTTTPLFVDALLELDRPTKYRNGVLVKLADTVEESLSADTLNLATEIRDHLRSRGATNWYNLSGQ